MTGLNLEFEEAESDLLEGRRMQIDLSLYDIQPTGEITKISGHKKGPVSVFKSPNGYLNCHLRTTDGKRRKFLHHRVLAELFIPNPDDLPQVNHINGDKTDNCLENLEWVRCADNIKHAHAHLLTPRKLTPDDMIDINWLKGWGVSNQKLADAYQVDHSTMYRAVTGRTWGFL